MLGTAAVISRHRNISHHEVGTPAIKSQLEIPKISETTPTTNPLPKLTYNLEETF